jgi:hypothetical protein
MKMMDLRSELSFARQLRTCPPTGIMMDPTHREAVEKHLAGCPYCRTGQVEDDRAWSELVSGWKGAMPSSSSSVDAGVAPGQIRFIRPELGRWRQGLYYTPPAVLVLSPVPGIRGAFRAAQVFFGSALAAPGDLVLEHARTGAGELMVECWNTYPVKGEDLGPKVGCVSDEVMEAARALGQDPTAVPDWAVYPHRMEEHDARIYFRELEVEVSYVFASEAVSELMDEVEKPRLKLVYSSREKMKAEVGGELLKLDWPERFETLEEGLAAARLPSARYAMAAADEEGEVLAANFVLVQNGLVKDIRPIHAQILQRKAMQGGFIIGGRIIDMPQEQGMGRFLAFLEREGRTMLSAADAKFDRSTGHFTTTFKPGGEGHGSLKIAVFCYVDDV